MKAYRFLNRFLEDIDVIFADLVGSSNFRNTQKRIMKKLFIPIDYTFKYLDKTSADFCFNY